MGVGANLANDHAGDFTTTPGNSTYPSSQNHLTNVGAFGGSGSYYGTFDQGGNVWEWNDAVIGSSRGLRGGAWFTSDSGLQSSNRSNSNPTDENDLIGFRLASVPEPSSVLMVAISGVVLVTRRRRPTL